MDSHQEEREKMTERTTERLRTPQPGAESQSWSVRSRRSFRGTRAPRTVCRALAGLLLLAVAAVPVPPAPAQAAILVSNLGQGAATGAMDASWDPEVQGFQTGTHQTGYSLTSVQLHIDSFVTPATIAGMTIKLRPGSEYNPDVLTFSNPTFTSAETVTFTLPTGTTYDLTPETRYFVVIDVNTSDTTGGVVLGTTTVTDEDSGAAAGWEIDDDSQWNSSGTWIGNGYMYRIAVDATLKNIPATGLPTITGTAAAVGDVLTAATTGISDVDGLTGVSYSYQWIRVDDMAVETDISGARSSTYTLVTADVGKHFKVKVTFDDDRSFSESRTSKLHPARTGGICARTEQVRDAIVAATAATTCANVTASHLSGLLGILNVSNQSISSLQSGDFAGLTGLTQLNLRNNALNSLPANIFAGLTALWNLNLRNNALSNLPSGRFAGLTALRQLDLSDNALTTVPANIFNELTALETLTLQNNALTSLPANSFAGLTTLRTLTLTDNDLILSGLPAGLFAGLTALENLYLANNDTLTGLPAGLFTGLTALDDLTLSYNALSSLPAGIFDGLTELDTLRLTSNDLTSLPANVFQDLTTLTTLELRNNSNTPFAPTAESGEAQMVSTGAAVTLAGSSSGPWGTNVTYAWTQTSGTTVTLTGADTASPSFTAPSTAGDLVFTLTVTGRPAGARGTATGTGTVTVEVTDPATLATLSDLTLSVGTLDPEFDTDTDTYTASVLNSVTTLTVTPTTTGSNATVEYLDSSDNAITDTDSNTPGLQVALPMNLAATTHVIKVKVTAETGTPQATKTYTLTVTKEASTVQLPDEPTGLTATPADEPTQIDLEWTAPVDDGNSALTGYRIEVSTDGSNGSWTDLEANTGNADTTYAHIGLDPGDTRHYRVSARNVLGPGDPSDTPRSATTLSGGICARTAQVRNAIVAATPATTCADVTPAHLASLGGTLDVTSQDITSLKPGDFAGLTNLFALILERNALTELPADIFDPLTELEWLDLSSNTLTSLPSGIFNRLTALVDLYLSNNALTSLPAGIFDRLTALETLRLGGNDLGSLPSGIFDRLTALTLLVLHDTSLESTGLPPGIFDRLTALERLDLCDNPRLTELTLPSFLYDKFPNPAVFCLPENVRVRRAAAGTSVPTTPGEPQNLSEVPGDGQMTLTWEAPSSDGGSAITGYQYEIDDSGTWLDAGLDLEGTVTLEQTVTDLTNGQEYAFAVRAVNAVGPGPAASVTATPVTTPGVPQNLKWVPGDGQVTLTWEAPSSDGGSAITRYQYEIDDSGTWLAVGLDRQVTVTGLTNDRQYTVAVRAVNAIGDGDEATVTVTLVQSGPLLRAWLSRFGRTVATHVTDTVGERMRDTAAPSSHVTVGGYRLPLGTRGADPAEPGADPRSPGKKQRPEATEAGALLSMGTESGSAVGPKGTRPGPGDVGLDPWADRPGQDPRVEQTQALRLRDLFMGSSFRLMLGGDDTRPGAMRLTAWGRVAGTQFNGRDRDVALDGDVITGTLGVDSEWERWLAGVAVSHSRGDGAYRIAGSGGDGELENALTSIHPYLRYAVNERLDVWGVLGYGWGDVTLKPGPGVSLETGTTLVMGSFGGRGILLPATELGGFELATRTDAMLTRMTSDADAVLDATEADAHRLRLVLEGTREVTWPEGQSVTPAVEIGLRHDWGDAETGFGLELGGRVQYADPTLGLTIEAAVRGLLAHEDSDYGEWGASGSLRIVPGPDGQGLALTLAPTWGAASSGVEGLWSRQTTAGLAPQGRTQSPTGRLNAEIGYGVAAPFGTGLLTPYAGTVLTDSQARTYRLGTRWTSLSGLTLNVEAQRQESAAGQQPLNQGLQLQIGWGF